VKASSERALSIKHVFSAGDEAGIVCEVTPTRNPMTVVLVSLTHLRVAEDHPLAAPIVGYPLERVRRLATGRPSTVPNAGHKHLIDYI
jgi:hypothetical protein